MDDAGNFFKLKQHGDGGFGEKLFVNLVDTPFYADGPRSEPVAYKDLLVTHLEELGFRLQFWEGLKGRLCIFGLGGCKRSMGRRWWMLVYFMCSTCMDI